MLDLSYNVVSDRYYGITLLVTWHNFFTFYFSNKMYINVENTFKDFIHNSNDLYIGKF